MKHKTAVVIGRFSPVHKGHVALFRSALEEAHSLVIYIGSPRDHSSKNPWDFHQRAEFIQESMEGHVDRIMFRAAYDHPSDQIWARRIVDLHATIYNDDSPVLVGRHKDQSSKYLDLFPWDYKEADTDVQMNATDVRAAFFREEPDFDFITNCCHPSVVEKLKDQYDAGFNLKFTERFK